jgi:hypothetical protein
MFHRMEGEFGSLCVLNVSSDAVLLLGLNIIESSSCFSQMDVIGKNGFKV